MEQHVVNLVQAESDTMIFKQHPRDEYEPIEWFSNSTYQPYKEQFFIGLDLNNTFNMSGECIGHTF
jgi:hypothetical protein